MPDSMRHIGGCARKTIVCSIHHVTLWYSTIPVKRGNRSTGIAARICQTTGLVIDVRALRHWNWLSFFCSAGPCIRRKPGSQELQVRSSSNACSKLKGFFRPGMVIFPSLASLVMNIAAPLVEAHANWIASGCDTVV